MRDVVGLEWARRCSRPSFIGKSRPRGAKLQGLRYERILGKALPAAECGQWFEFRDRQGLGWCQTDLLLVVPSGVLVLEAKYSWVPEGHRQVGQYLPIVSKALGLPACGAVVCKVLRAGMPPGVQVVGDLPSALRLARSGAPVVLHWLGIGMLWPPSAGTEGSHTGNAGVHPHAA